MTIPVRQCIRQVQMGDVDAIADICQLYNPFIQSMARKYSYVYGSIHDARSVATTALIECIYSYDLADNVDVPLAIVRFVRKQFGDDAYRYKQEQSLLEKNVYCPEGGTTDLPDYLEDQNAVCPMGRVIELEEKEELQRALDTLDEKERRLVCLRHKEAWTFRSISEEHGIPIPSIQTVINRGVRKLRSHYGLDGDAPKKIPKKYRGKK